MSGSTKTVLLLGNYRPTLVLAETLNRDGYRVIAGLDGCDRGAEVSRFVDEVWDHPPVKRDADAFFRALSDLIAERSDICCVYPVAEEFVRAFAEQEPALPDRVVLAMVPAATILTCLDKRTMMTMAKDAGVPIAPFAEVSNLDDLTRQAEAIGFPIVIRPADSTKRLNGEKALAIPSAAALTSAFAAWPADHSSLLIQKKASGLRHNIYFGAIDGDIRRYLHAIITRTDRKDGSGLAVDGITIAPDSDLRRHTDALVRDLGYTGVGCAQYLVDAETGAVSFLEINARIAGNHAVPERCGLDLGRFLMALSAGDEVCTRDRREGDVGIRYSWVAGDVEGLKSSWRRGEITGREALAWTKTLIATAFGAHIDMMLTWRDPLPGLFTLADVIPGLGHLTRRRHTHGAFNRKPHADAKPLAPDQSLSHAWQR